VSLIPMLATSSTGCSCAQHDPIAASYEASLQNNTILSTQTDAPLIMNAEGIAPIPDGMQFYMAFQLDWQGDDREEFQVLMRVADPVPTPSNQILLWQFFGTSQVQLVITVNGVERSLIVDQIMFNSDRDWIVQVTDDGRAQLFIDNVLRGEMVVGDISPIPRGNVELGDNTSGFGNQVWGEYTNVRADVNGDSLADIVQVPPPRLPVPFTAQPIPDLPNPNPNGFTNTPNIPNADRIIAVADTGNSIIDAIAMPAGWKGDTITFAFNVQDIDNNGISDFDEGGWRAFYTSILTNVTAFTGVDFWERPDGQGTIEYQLAPGGGGASGTPGLFAAPNSGTLIGIGGTVEEAGRNIGAINFTHTWFHETGHALGLAHPHDFERPDGIDTGIGQGGTAVNQPGDHYLNSKLYSSTTYSRMIWGEDNPFTSAIDFGTSLDRMDQSTYLPFDIAALQHIYGVNRTFALGDDTYTFNDSGLQSRGLRTIWDNGGIDTILYAGSMRSVINLNDATIRQEVGGGGFLSTSEALDAGFLIANGVTIENAVGGEQQDFITGNEAANLLFGNGGDDSIRGGDGRDTLNGGAGRDTLDGGSDMDVAVLAGARTQYSQSNLGNNTWAFTHTATGVVDTLRDIETVRFEASGETLVLSASAFAARALEITQPLPPVPGKPFFAEALVRFDNLAGGGWQRVFDFGNGPERQNILLTQAGNSRTMRLDVYGTDRAFSLEATNAIVQGETAKWRVEITELGFARILKNDVVVAEGRGVPVPDVPRANLLVGTSNWGGDTPLIGQIVYFISDINGDGAIDVQRGVPPARPDGVVTGTDGNDNMAIGFVDVPGDVIDGADGLNDSISAGLGDDLVDAGGGADVVFGGAGQDTLNGGTFDSGADTIYGDVGNDLVFGGTGGADLLFGGDDNDTLGGGSDVDLLYGGAGDDVLHGDMPTGGTSGAGADTLFGGEGNDQLYLNPNANAQGGQAYGGAGNDYVQGTNFGDYIEGGLGDDFVVAAAGDDFLRGREGNDYFDAGDGNDNVMGELGDDVLRGRAGNDWQSGGEGNDNIMGEDGADTVFGDAGNDFLGGEEGNDSLLGGDGNDTVDAGGGADVVFGGAGQDTLNGGTFDSGADTIYGDAGNDLVFGGTGGADLLFGGDDNDTLGGGSDVDLLYGGAGDDVLHGDMPTGGTSGAGSDTLFGGEGNDQLYLNPNANAQGGQAYGGAGNDYVQGTNFGDYIEGGLGDDFVVAAAGDDFLRGREGNDYFDAGDGNDNVMGELGDDVLRGRAGNDWQSGGEGNDNIMGEDGADTVFGDAGNDFVSGGAGNDLVFGGDGNDTVEGGSGNDVLTGNLGADRFVFNLGFGRDVVIDFSAQDQIRFSADLWASTGATSIGAFLNAATVQRGADVALIFSAADEIQFNNMTRSELIAQADLFSF
jgi:serralysin